MSFCGSKAVIKKGKQSGIQRFQCKKCGKKFQSLRRDKSNFLNKLWNKYVWKKQTVSDLANTYNRSEKWIRNQLNKIAVKSIVSVHPQPVVVGADATFFSRSYGVIVFRSAELRKNLWWRQISTENADVYQQGKEHLEKNGFTIMAAVIDGKKGVKQVFSGIPVQMCQYHQKKIINRYLTLQPKLEAGQELKTIVKTLTMDTEVQFTSKLNEWHEKWKDFLKERTINFETNRWCYTHKRLRSAYRSLKTNLPILFTYQKYPDLNIPNTNNSLEGSFTNLKCIVNNHKGLVRQRRYRVIVEVLKGKPGS